MAACRVLVVEDEPDIVHILRLILEDGGHVVEVFETLAAALDRLPRLPAPDLLILDRRLPDGDGLTLCRAVRARGGQAPVLVLSAVVSSSDAEAALAAGATRVMAKPFDPDALAESVDDLCASIAPAA